MDPINLSSDFYLFRMGMDRTNRIPANEHFPMPPIANTRVFAIDNITIAAYLSPQIAGSLASGHTQREGYWLENVSSSASLNTGKFLVKTWIEDGVGVKYKCFAAVYDIDLSIPDISQWNAPSTVKAGALYPNPVQEVLSIENSTDEIASYSIYSIDGKQLLSETNVNATAHPIDVSNLTTGSYILTTQHQSGATHQYKFIKL